jgi:transcriptional regulator with XRE-family HTH domain
MEWFEMLREARLRLGLSQVELASRAFVSIPSVKLYEQGRRHPSRPYLVALLEALGLERIDRARILEAAGYRSDDYSHAAEYPTGMFSAAEAAKEVHKYPWPAYVVGDSLSLIEANNLAQRLWDVDLENEFLSPVERNFLSVATIPRFADRCLNWEEAARMLLSIMKGKPERPQTLEAPSPYFAAVLQHFLAGDPKYVSRLIPLWNEVPPLWEGKMRNTYPIVWEDPDFGVLRFQCVASIAHHVESTNFNDWIPVDAATWEALESIRKRPVHRER